MNSYLFVLDPATHSANWKKNISWDTAQKINFQHKIQLKKLNTQITLIHLRDSTPKLANANDPFPSISLLKSLLQKQIRRCETEPALITAKQYITNHFASFIRRLIIILCEDVFLDPNIFLILSWFSLAITKTNYQISTYDAELCLNIIQALCQETRFVEPKFLPEPPNIPIEQRNAQELQLPENQMLLSLSYYVAYTTFFLQGDQHMFHYALANYQNITKMTPIQILFQPIFHNIPTFGIDNFQTFGIDFHNYPDLTQKLISYTKVLQANEDEIKETIWIMRSGINKRKPNLLDELDEDKQLRILKIWNKIAQPVEYLTKKYILYKAFIKPTNEEIEVHDEPEIDS